VSRARCKRARAAQTIGAGVIHLDEAAFMQRPRHMLEADVVLHKVDGDLDLLKMVKARPIPARSAQPYQGVPQKRRVLPTPMPPALTSEEWP
jgi:hypothetical protein